MKKAQKQSKISKETSNSLKNLSWVNKNEVQKETLKKPVNKKTERKTERTGERANVATDVSGNHGTRPIEELLDDEVRHHRIRMSFELFQYHVEALESIDEESRVKRKKGINKSDIVRRALDAYLGLDKNK